MSDYASFIPNSSPVSGPPEMKFIGALVAAAFSFFFLGFIFFILFESSMDIAGHPLYTAPDYSAAVPDADVKKFTLEPDTPESIASKLRLLSPLPDSAMAEQKVPIICFWDSDTPFPLLSADLKVDGILREWEMQFGSTVWVVNVYLPNGEHTLQAATLDAAFFVGSSPGAERKALQFHSGIGDVQRCGDCHRWVDKPTDLVRKGHGLTLGAWKGNESCTACHNEPEFRAKHLSFSSPNENCGNCHLVHGTTEPGKLLKAKK